MQVKNNLLRVKCTCLRCGKKIEENDEYCEDCMFEIEII